MQHCLLLIPEKWKLSVYNNEAFGALLTELSKSFDCLSHELLIAKLHSYVSKIAKRLFIKSHTWNKKFETFLVNGETLKLVQAKGQYLTHFYSAFLFVIYF